MVRIKLSKEQRLSENKEYLKNLNIFAFLKAIAEAEGGGYDFKYGAINVSGQPAHLCSVLRDW